MCDSEQICEFVRSTLCHDRVKWLNRAVPYLNTFVNKRERNANKFRNCIQQICLTFILIFTFLQFTLTFHERANLLNETEWQFKPYNGVEIESDTVWVRTCACAVCSFDKLWSDTRLSKSLFICSTATILHGWLNIELNEILSDAMQHVGRWIGPTYPSGLASYRLLMLLLLIETETPCPNRISCLDSDATTACLGSMGVPQPSAFSRTSSNFRNFA